MDKGEEIVLKVPIIIEKDHGEYHAFCPIFKGLHVGGKTKEEVRKNAKDAVVAYVMSLIKHHEPISLYAFEAEKRRERKKLVRSFTPQDHRRVEHILATV